MIDSANRSSPFNRREAVHEGGATAALVVASGAGSLSCACTVMTAINASDSNAAGFWPSGARRRHMMVVMPTFYPEEQVP